MAWAQIQAVSRNRFRWWLWWRWKWFPVVVGAASIFPDVDRVNGWWSIFVAIVTEEYKAPHRIFCDWPWRIYVPCDEIFHIFFIIFCSVVSNATVIYRIPQIGHHIFSYCPNNDMPILSSSYPCIVWQPAGTQICFGTVLDMYVFNVKLKVMFHHTIIFLEFSKFSSALLLDACIYVITNSIYIYIYICMHRVWQALGVHFH